MTRSSRQAAAEAVRAVLAAAAPSFPRAGMLVGFSGGPDSTVLLRLLVAEARRRSAPLDGKEAVVAAHLDHALQPDSAEAARFAAREARSLGVPCIVARRDVRGRARAGGRSLQEAAREERLDFLAAAARSRGLAAVALGHTLSDQAETLLLRLARGSGTAGLAAMAPARPLPGPGPPLDLLRPLLRVPRSDVEAIVRAEAWPVREDPSNRDLRFARNRLRRGALLRFAEETNPALESALGRAAELLRDDEAWLGEQAAEAFRRLASTSPDWVDLPAAGLLELPPALARRVVRLALRTVRGHLRRIGLVHVDDVLGLVRSGRGGASLDLPGATARFERGALRIRAAAAAPGPGGEAAGKQTCPNAPGSGRVLPLEARTPEDPNRRL